MIKIRNWTEEQVTFLFENYDKYTVRELSKKLNKSESSVTGAAKKLGFSKITHKKWTDEELQYLRNNYLDMSVEEISKNVCHTIAAVNTKLGHLGLVKDKPWSDEDIDYLISNWENTNYSIIAKKLSRTEGAIRAKCFDLNLIKNDRWTLEDENYLKEVYYRIPTKDIAKILNRTPSSIQIKAKKLGLKKYPYHCNYQFFKEINTEEKAYWLGFLSADGWINKNDSTGSGVVGTEIQYGDINHLKKFNKSLEGNYRITDRWRTCSLSSNPDKLNHMCCLRIFSTDMYNDLLNLGFSCDKSYTFKIPEIPNELMRHYIRGYFDGDGCFSIHRNKNGSMKTFSCSFVSASGQAIDDFEQILHDVGFDAIRIECLTRDGFAPIWRLHINQGRNKDKLRFLDYLYKDATIYLDRKYARYQQVLEHYTIRSPHQTEMSGSF